MGDCECVSARARVKGDGGCLDIYVSISTITINDFSSHFKFGRGLEYTKFCFYVVGFIKFNLI